MLLPTPPLAERITRLARDVGAELIVLDPALPVGLLGPRLSIPYALVLHGAEVTVPGRLPVSQQVMSSVLRGAEVIIAAGGYPAFEARRAARCALPIVVVPPGVDAQRFRPLAPDERADVRRRLGLDPDGRVIVGVSRLVPRKGFDTLLKAASRLVATRPDLEVAIAGGGRDRQRLERVAAEQQAPVRFLGRVPDDDLPSVYAAGDVFAMLCRDRWAGLEQEGFGIVFLEAAACGVPQVAGHSGGSDEAVVDGVTGRVVHGDDPLAVAAALAPMLDDATLRHRMGDAALCTCDRRVRLHPPRCASGRCARRTRGRSNVTIPKTIIRASWIGTVIFGVTATAAAIAPDLFAGVALAVALVLFFVGCAVFLVAFLKAVGRSREVDIGIGGLYFLAGSAPREVQLHLLGSFGAEVVIAFRDRVGPSVHQPRLRDARARVRLGMLWPVGSPLRDVLTPIDLSGLERASRPRG